MASIFDNDFVNHILDTFTGGYATTQKSASTIEEAGKEYKSNLEDISKNLKSAQQLYQEGKEAASSAAANKAGIAKRNAKAAAMQTGGSKLLSAIQGAQAANDASAQGFDETAANQAALGANIQSGKATLAGQGAQAAYNAKVASAEAKAQRAQNRANGAAQAAASIGSSFVQGLGKKE